MRTTIDALDNTWIRGSPARLLNRRSLQTPCNADVELISYLIVGIIGVQEWLLELFCDAVADIQQLAQLFRGVHTEYEKPPRRAFVCVPYQVLSVRAEGFDALVMQRMFEAVQKSVLLGCLENQGSRERYVKRQIDLQVILKEAVDLCGLLF